MKPTAKRPPERPPLYRAVVDVDWEVRGKRVSLTPADEPTDQIPRGVAAWMLRLDPPALEEVKRDDDR